MIANQCKRCGGLVDETRSAMWPTLRKRRCHRCGATDYIHKESKSARA